MPAADVVLASPLSTDNLLGSSALLVLSLILFTECGLLVCFFLPGDTLLFAAGIKIAVDPSSVPPFAAFLVVAPIAVLAGNLLGYGFGWRFGPRVFDRPGSRLFKPEFVQRAHSFYERFGWGTIVAALFVPVVRTVAPVVAGVGRMPVTRYAAFSAIGAVAWTDGVLILGRELGRINFVQRHKGWIDYVVIVVVLVALVPVAVHYLQARRRRAS